MFSLDVLILTNKVSIFKLTIKEYFKDDFRLIRAQFFTLALIKSVTFFWDTRYFLRNNAGITDFGRMHVFYRGEFFSGHHHFGYAERVLYMIAAGGENEI